MAGLLGLIPSLNPSEGIPTLSGYLKTLVQGPFCARARIVPPFPRAAVAVRIGVVTPVARPGSSSEVRGEALWL